MIILLLKEYERLIITAQNKIKIMFKIYFSFLLIIFMKNIEKYNYFSLIDDRTSITHRKMIKIIYIINLNKILKINKKLVKRCDSSFALFLNKYVFSLINTSRKEFNYCILKRFLR